MSGRLVWVEDPKARPISTAKWVPLAKKHKLSICFHVGCVSYSGLIHFWGDNFADQDVGACVLRVVNDIAKGGAA